MTWSREDPAQGSPAAIQGLATLRRARAGKIRDAQRSISAAATGSGAEWKAMSQTAFASKLSEDAADIELIAIGLETQAAALQNYAGQLSQLQDRQRILERQRRSAQDALAAAQQRWLFGGFGNVDVFTLAQSNGDDTSASERKQQKSMVQGQIDGAQADGRAVDVQWEQLVADRRQMDARCAAALQDVKVLGSLAGVTSGSIAGSTPASLMAMLSTLSKSDLVILLQQHPELARALDQAEPDDVASWWRDLPDDQRAALIAGAPTLVGALDGVPALDRVAANKINAANRIKQAEREIQDWRDKGASFGQRDFYLDEIKELNAEIAYLQEATGADATVQLYLYDQKADRIVEMIGTPSQRTSQVVTYVPGTLAKLGDFYDGAPQQIPTWLHNQNPDGVVAFVYKDGRFPQNPLTEANDQEYARNTGKTLANFEDGMRQDPDLRDAESVAIGHSWGLSNVTSSEVAGAHYDKVVSLSGAGELPDWRKSPTTKYADFSYYDVLQFAQELPLNGDGPVWDGRNPRDSGFDHGTYYDAPLTFKSFPGNGLVSPLLAGMAGLDAHNLAATASPDNYDLLNDMKRFIDSSDK
jgi:hypothetical protein